MTKSKHTTRCNEKHDFDECFEITSLCICEEAEFILTDAEAKQVWVEQLFAIAGMEYKEAKA
jgi:hypothetical protein